MYRWISLVNLGKINGPWLNPMDLSVKRECKSSMTAPPTTPMLNVLWISKVSVYVSVCQWYEISKLLITPWAVTQKSVPIPSCTLLYYTDLNVHIGSVRMNWLVFYTVCFLAANMIWLNPGLNANSACTQPSWGSSQRSSSYEAVLLFTVLHTTIPRNQQYLLLLISSGQEKHPPGQLQH